MIIGILGLVLPGYLLARALRLPAALAVAFPLSALMLTETIVAYVYVGVAICMTTVLVALAAACAVSLAVMVRRRPRGGALPGTAPSDAPRWLQAIVAVQVGLILAGIFVKACAAPLSGPDTPYRWDALARLMLDEQNLLHYPPTSAEDFTKYTYPDAISPLVSTVYWWLYAGWGDPAPRLTSVAIVLQAASCFGLVYFAGCMINGTLGGLLAVAALSSSYRYFIAVVIGQETGYTALSVAGQLAFALAAARDPRPSLAVAAGMFAGIGGLSREYGPLLSLCGFAVLASWPATRRLVLLFCAVSAACAAPWYVRNWLITGNPLYAMDVLRLGLPANAVHEGLHAAYREKVGLHTFTAEKWAHVALELLMGAPLALGIGLPGIVRSGRNGLALAVSVVLVGFLWVWSIPYTHGGVTLSMRVLAPALVALSIAAAACAPAISRLLTASRPYLRVAVWAALVACGGGAMLAAWSFPGSVWEIGTKAFFQWNYEKDSLGPNLPLTNMLEATDLPAVGVLTDNPYAAVALRRFTRFRPVLIWSPEVAFVFEK
jgi:hypothetical protein